MFSKMDELKSMFCNDTEKCDEIVYLNTGIADESMRKDVLQFQPSGTSTAFIQYISQQIKNGQIFKRHDYGVVENLREYKSAEAPAYNLTAVANPILIIFSDTDVLVSKKDIEQHVSLLKQVSFFRISTGISSHLAYLWEPKTKQTVSLEVLKSLKRVRTQDDILTQDILGHYDFNSGEGNVMKKGLKYTLETERKVVQIDPNHFPMQNLYDTLIESILKYEHKTKSSLLYVFLTSNMTFTLKIKVLNEIVRVLNEKCSSTETNKMVESMKSLSDQLEIFPSINGYNTSNYEIKNITSVKCLPHSIIEEYTQIITKLNKYETEIRSVFDYSILKATNVSTTEKIKLINSITNYLRENCIKNCLEIIELEADTLKLLSQIEDINNGEANLSIPNITPIKILTNKTIHESNEINDEYSKVINHLIKYESKTHSELNYLSLLALNKTNKNRLHDLEQIIRLLNNKCTGQCEDIKSISLEFQNLHNKLEKLPSIEEINILTPHIITEIENQSNETLKSIITHKTGGNTDIYISIINKVILYDTRSNKSSAYKFLESPKLSASEKKTKLLDIISQSKKHCINYCESYLVLEEILKNIINDPEVYSETIDINCDENGFYCKADGHRLKGATYDATKDCMDQNKPCEETNAIKMTSISNPNKALAEITEVHKFPTFSNISNNIGPIVTTEVGFQDMYSNNRSECKINCETPLKYFKEGPYDGYTANCSKPGLNCQKIMINETASGIEPTNYSEERHYTQNTSFEESGEPNDLSSSIETMSPSIEIPNEVVNYNETTSGIKPSNYSEERHYTPSASLEEGGRPGDSQTSIETMSSSIEIPIEAVNTNETTSGIEPSNYSEERHYTPSASLEEGGRPGDSQTSIETISSSIEIPNEVVNTNETTSGIEPSNYSEERNYTQSASLEEGRKPNHIPTSTEIMSSSIEIPNEVVNYNETKSSIEPTNYLEEHRYTPNTSFEEGGKPNHIPSSNEPMSSSIEIPNEVVNTNETASGTESTNYSEERHYTQNSSFEEGRKPNHIPTSFETTSSVVQSIVEENIDTSSIEPVQFPSEDSHDIFKSNCPEPGTNGTVFFKSNKSDIEKVISSKVYSNDDNILRTISTVNSFICSSFEPNCVLESDSKLDNTTEPIDELSPTQELIREELIKTYKLINMYVLNKSSSFDNSYIISKDLSNIKILEFLLTKVRYLQENCIEQCEYIHVLESHLQNIHKLLVETNYVKTFKCPPSDPICSTYMYNDTVLLEENASGPEPVNSCESFYNIVKSNCSERGSNCTVYFKSDKRDIKTPVSLEEYAYDNNISSKITTVEPFNCSGFDSNCVLDSNTKPDNTTVFTDAISPTQKLIREELINTYKLIRKYDLKGSSFNNNFTISKDISNHEIIEVLITKVTYLKDKCIEQCEFLNGLESHLQNIDKLLVKTNHVSKLICPPSDPSCSSNIHDHQYVFEKNIDTNNIEPAQFSREYYLDNVKTNCTESGTHCTEFLKPDQSDTLQYRFIVTRTNNTEFIQDDEISPTHISIRDELLKVFQLIRVIDLEKNSSSNISFIIRREMSNIEIVELLLTKVRYLKDNCTQKCESLNSLELHLQNVKKLLVETNHVDGLTCSRSDPSCNTNTHEHQVSVDKNTDTSDTEPVKFSSEDYHGIITTNCTEPGSNCTGLFKSDMSDIESAIFSKEDSYNEQNLSTFPTINPIICSSLDPNCVLNIDTKLDNAAVPIDEISQNQILIREELIKTYKIIRKYDLEKSSSFNNTFIISKDMSNNKIVEFLLEKVKYLLENCIEECAYLNGLESHLQNIDKLLITTNDVDRYSCLPADPSCTTNIRDHKVLLEETIDSEDSHDIVKTNCTEPRANCTVFFKSDKSDIESVITSYDENVLNPISTVIPINCSTFDQNCVQDSDTKLDDATAPINEISPTQMLIRDELMKTYNHIRKFEVEKGSSFDHSFNISSSISNIEIVELLLTKVRYLKNKCTHDCEYLGSFESHLKNIEKLLGETNQVNKLNCLLSNSSCLTSIYNIHSNKIPVKENLTAIDFDKAVIAHLDSQSGTLEDIREKYLKSIQDILHHVKRQDPDFITSFLESGNIASIKKLDILLKRIKYLKNKCLERCEDYDSILDTLQSMRNKLEKLSTSYQLKTSGRYVGGIDENGDKTIESQNYEWESKKKKYLTAIVRNLTEYEYKINSNFSYSFIDLANVSSKEMYILMNRINYIKERCADDCERINDIETQVQELDKQVKRKEISKIVKNLMEYELKVHSNFNYSNIESGFITPLEINTILFKRINYITETCLYVCEHINNIKEELEILDNQVERNELNKIINILYNKTEGNSNFGYSFLDFNNTTTTEIRSIILQRIQFMKENCVGNCGRLNFVENELTKLDTQIQRKDLFKFVSKLIAMETKVHSNFNYSFIDSVDVNITETYIILFKRIEYMKEICLEGCEGINYLESELERLDKYAEKKELSKIVQKLMRFDLSVHSKFSYTFIYFDNFTTTEINSILFKRIIHIKQRCVQNCGDINKAETELRELDNQAQKKEFIKVALKLIPLESNIHSNFSYSFIYSTNVSNLEIEDMLFKRITYLKENCDENCVGINDFETDMARLDGQIIRNELLTIVTKLVEFESETHSKFSYKFIDSPKISDTQLSSTLLKRLKYLKSKCVAGCEGINSLESELLGINNQVKRLPYVNKKSIHKHDNNIYLNTTFLGSSTQEHVSNESYIKELTDSRADLNIPFLEPYALKQHVSNASYIKDINEIIDKIKEYELQKHSNFNHSYVESSKLSEMELLIVLFQRIIYLQDTCKEQCEDINEIAIKMEHVYGTFINRILLMNANNNYSDIFQFVTKEKFVQMLIKIYSFDLKFKIAPQINYFALLTSNLSSMEKFEIIFKRLVLIGNECTEKCEEINKLVRQMRGLWVRLKSINNVKKTNIAEYKVPSILQIEFTKASDIYLSFEYHFIKEEYLNIVRLLEIYERTIKSSYNLTILVLPEVSSIDKIRLLTERITYLQNNCISDCTEIQNMVYMIDNLQEQIKGLKQFQVNDIDLSPPKLTYRSWLDSQNHTSEFMDNVRDFVQRTKFIYFDDQIIKL